MHNVVQHFEIYADSPEKLAGFYQDVFGWKIATVPGMEYWMIQASPSNEKGMPVEPGTINGGLMRRPMPDARAWMNYVTVASIDETTRQIQRRGGQVLRSKFAIPRMGWAAVVADPEMNPFGLWQSDPTAA
jgi:predicted enzyme related to lactoylglutathione lyase